MLLLSWNIRGLGSSIKKRFLFKLLKKQKPDIILVQETKLDKVERIVIQRMWRSSDFGFACSDAVGASGGFCVFGMKVFSKWTT